MVMLYTIAAIKQYIVKCKCVKQLYALANAQFSFYGLYKLVQALKVSKVISKQARSIF